MTILNLSEVKMDYIKMERIWQDINMFQLKILCVSDIISVSTNVYIDDCHINTLRNKLNAFLNNEIEHFQFIVSEKGNSSANCLSMDFYKKDKVGHILIEVYVELLDGGNFDTHNCCFYIKSEMGLLWQFMQELADIQKPIIGTCITLNKV